MTNFEATKNCTSGRIDCINCPYGEEKLGSRIEPVEFPEKRIKEFERVLELRRKQNENN